MILLGWVGLVGCTVLDVDGNVPERVDSGGHAEAIGAGHVALQPTGEDAVDDALARPRSRVLGRPAADKSDE